LCPLPWMISIRLVGECGGRPDRRLIGTVGLLGEDFLGAATCPPGDRPRSETEARLVGVCPTNAEIGRLVERDVASNEDRRGGRGSSPSLLKEGVMAPSVSSEPAGKRVARSQRHKSP
jgi:hypothetical protein